MIVKAYRYRISPSKEHKVFLDTCFDISRFVWNNIHASYTLWNEGRFFSKYDPIKDKYYYFVDRNFVNRSVTQFVNDCYVDEDMPWFKPKHIPKRAIDTITKDYFETWKRYFKAVKNNEIEVLRAKKIEKYKLKGQPIKWKVVNDIGKPKFKKFHENNSFRTDRGITVNFEKSELCFSGQTIPFICHRLPQGLFSCKTVSLSKTKTGKYYCSITVWHEKDLPKKVEIKESVGIDFGVKDFATLSNGFVYKNPKIGKKNERKIKRLQRKLSRQQVKSNRWKLTKQKIALLYEQSANRRSNFIHNVTAELTDNFDIISIENLNVKGMTAASKGVKKQDGSGFKKNKKAAKAGLNKAILDVAPYEFKRQVKYKAESKGKHYTEVGTFFPSSKKCNVCDYKNTKLKLSQRTWTCSNCGTKHDRDLNAALNIEKQGLENYKKL